MKFTLTIDLDNAAFEDNPAEEIETLLTDVAEALEYYSTTWERNLAPVSNVIRDTNGNTIGSWEISE